MNLLPQSILWIYFFVVLFISNNKVLVYMRDIQSKKDFFYFSLFWYYFINQVLTKAFNLASQTFSMSVLSNVTCIMRCFIKITSVQQVLKVLHCVVIKNHIIVYSFFYFKPTPFSIELHTLSLVDFIFQLWESCIS